MSSNSSGLVAVAVSSGRSRSSRRAVIWAVQNLMAQAQRFVLVHVAPEVTSIPSPSGNHFPLQQMPGDVVAMYIQEMKVKSEETVLPFKKLSRTKEMETLVLDGDNAATALLKYISESGAESLVLGASSCKCILRKLKGPDVPSDILKKAPTTCSIYVISRKKIITKLANLSDLEGFCGNSKPLQLQQITMHKVFSDTKEGKDITKQMSEFDPHKDSKDLKTLEVSAREVVSGKSSQAFKDGISSGNSGGKSEVSFPLPSNEREHQEGDLNNIETRSPETQTSEGHDTADAFTDTSSGLLQFTNESDIRSEVAQLRLELQNTLALYNQTCEDLVYAKKKAQLHFIEYSEETRKVKDALEREEISKGEAAEEKNKHLEAIKDIEVARQVSANVDHKRHRAEMTARNELSEREEIVDALCSTDKRYRSYSRDEIEIATDCFSETKKIGEGGYGEVYKCNIDHTPVAVKVLRQETSAKKEEFLREVEVLSQLCHPHMVLLLGACPENGCLVYEYMENGSLEDRLFCKGGTPPLPWFVRFRTAYEMACALAFLHATKPEPIVHRDLKPGNILLDRNYVSKIADVGLAKIISDVVPDSVTEYRDTVLAGTLYYMDPEYQRTGTLRPKSDLYAFGIITLQLLTAKHPLGLLATVENAINNGSFANILDKSISDWPLAESGKLANIALKCSRLRCRDRPDLESEVIPVLKELLNMADAHVKLQQCQIHGPSHYFCPILQDVMDDPYVAADGFTYEYRAIKAWLEKFSISPVTRLPLPHNRLTPNRSMRSAIQEWKMLAAFSTF